MACTAVESRLGNLSISEMSLDHHTDEESPQDFLEHLLKVQPRPFTYLEKVQKNTVTPTMRTCVIAWLRKLALRKKVNDSVFLDAVEKFDRFLNHMKVRPKHLKIISVACLYLAFERLPSRHSFPMWVRLAEGEAFTENDLARMVTIVRKKLSPTRTAVTPGMLLEALSHCIELPPLPDDDGSRTLASIPEDEEVAFDSQQVQRCLAEAMKFTVDLSKHYSLLAKFHGSTLAAVAMAFALEQLYGGVASGYLTECCQLLGVSKSAVKKACWLAAAEAQKPFPMAIFA